MPPAQGEVKVVVAGSDRAFAALTKSLTESLSFIAVTPQFERVATVDPHSVSQSHLPVKEIFARLWIDAAADYDVTLYITDAATERVFVRRMGLDHGLDKVAVEGLAFVAQSHDDQEIRDVGKRPDVLDERHQSHPGDLRRQLVEVR